VVCGISIAVSAAVSLLQCCTCNLCGLGNILDILLAAAGTVWWVPLVALWRPLVAAALAASVGPASVGPPCSTSQSS